MATPSADGNESRGAGGLATVPSDTTIDARNVQLRLLRAKSRGERISMALRISADVIRAARRAIAQSHPEYSQSQIAHRFQQLHYPELAHLVIERRSSEKMNESSDLLAALGPVLKELSRLGVRHYVGGSIASSMHGAARSTLDVDIGAELNEEVGLRLAEALADNYYVSREAVTSAIRHRAYFNLIHLDTSFKIDVFVLQDRPFERSVLNRAIVETIGNETSIAMSVATAEDIILLKLIWHRMGSESSERQWRDVTQVAMVQGKQLDRQYLDEWADRLAVGDLLARLMAEVNPADG